MSQDDEYEPPRQPPMMPLGEPPPAYLPPPPGRPEYNPERHRAWRMGCLMAVVVIFGFPALVTAVVYRSPIAFVWGFLFVVFLIATLAIFSVRRG